MHASRSSARILSSSSREESPSPRTPASTPPSSTSLDSLAFDYDFFTPTFLSETVTSQIPLFDDTLITRSGDNSLSNSYSENSSLNNTVTDINNMSDKAKKDNYLDIQKAKMFVDSDIHNLDISAYPKEFIKGIYDNGEVLNRALINAISFLSIYDSDIFKDEKMQEAIATKTTILEFLRKAAPVVMAVAPPDAATSVSATIKKTRVKNNKDVLEGEAQKLTLELQNLELNTPLTDGDVASLENKFSKLDKRSSSTVKDLRELYGDASDAGLADAARELDKVIYELKTSKDQCEAYIDEQKVKFGVTGTARDRTFRSDIKPPVFKGDSTVDFYSFKDEYQEYVATKQLTKSEQLQLLLRTCLEGAPKSECARFRCIEDAWNHLKEAYGNPIYLVDSALSEIRRMGACPAAYLKRRQWAINVLLKLRQTKELAEKFHLQEALYPSRIAFEVEAMLPEGTRRSIKKHMRQYVTDSGYLPESVHYTQLLTCLDEFVEICNFEINYSNLGLAVKEDQSKFRNAADRNRPQKPRSFTAQQAPPPPTTSRRKRDRVNHSSKPVSVQCIHCSGSHTHLFYCIAFQESLVKDRMKLTVAAKTCFRCLRMDSALDTSNLDSWWEGHKDSCSTDFACSQAKCPKLQPRLQRHVTMCIYHINYNKKVEEKFIDSLDQNLLPNDVKFFFLSSSYHSAPSNQEDEDPNVIPDVTYPAIFMLQTVGEPGNESLLFYDSGCGAAVISEKGAEKLSSTVLREGPTSVNVAGGRTITVPGGEDRWTIDLVESACKATFSGIRMPRITSEFPLFELTDAFEDLQRQYKQEFPGGPPLPKVGKSVGGCEVDIMIGIRYNRYFPKLIYELPCGLGIYKTKLRHSRGYTALLGGPHRAWEDAANISTVMGVEIYLTAEMRAYRAMTLCLTEDVKCQTADWQTDEMRHVDLPEKSALCLDWDGEISADSELPQCPHHDEHAEDECFHPSTNLDRTVYASILVDKLFLEADELGTEASYRCVQCRNCAKCRQSEIVERVSLKEENEQFMIEDSVTYNEEKQRLEISLPFLTDPVENLRPNFHIAKKILESQMRLLERNPEMKEDVLAAFHKLMDRGYVCRTEDLSSKETADMEMYSGEGYILPWRLAHKLTSMSTPVRPVFDASSKTPGGLSLNEILPKGMKTLINLLRLLFTFRSFKHAFAFDVSMAYNQLNLLPKFYKFQQFLWQDGLNTESPVERMVIKTAIYGVRPSGGQMQEGFSKVAQYATSKNSELNAASNIVANQMYVDDGLGGSDDRDSCDRLAKDVEKVLQFASIKIKDFTYSGRSPSDLVSTDGKTVGVLGLAWESEADHLYVDVKQIFFGKMRRGLKPAPVSGNIENALKECFTARNILSQVARIFDPMGLLTPVTAKLKLDLRNLFSVTNGWDDPAPVELLPLWADNLEVIQELGKIPFRRTVIPDNAASLDIQLLVSVDASENIAVAAVHSRILTTSGKFFVQLVGARSKLISGSTIPVAELKAAVLGSVFGHVVRMSFPTCKEIMNVTDSTIVLYWINQDARPMRTKVRNAVIEIRRFTHPDQWRHVSSELNIADLPTRGAGVEDVGPAGDWQNGKAWMSLPEDQMPLMTAEQMTLTAEERRMAAAEIKGQDSLGFILSSFTSKVGDRYKLSNYMVDPCSRPWDSCVRIVAIVFKFCNSLLCKIKGKNSKNFVDFEGVKSENLLDHGTSLYSDMYSTPQKHCKEGSYKNIDINIGKFTLTSFEITAAERYFFKKASLEVKHFSKLSEWKHCSIEKDDILFYKGRILEGQSVNDVENVFQDLSPCMFVRPIVDRYSPVAYSIMMFSHDKLARHRNVSSTLLESRGIAYILSGRDLAIEVRSDCAHCRRFRAKLSQVELGKLHEVRLTVAPAFYHCQIDLMGPFLATCEHNHRSSVKVWGVVFMCCFHHGYAKLYCRLSFTSVHRIFVTGLAPTQLFIDKGSQHM